MIGFGWGTELCLFLWYILDSKKPANQQNYAWTKMDIALQRTLSNAFPFNEKKSISIYDSLRFVLQSPFDNQVALAQVINSKQAPRGCINIKMPSYQYRNSHNKDKTVPWQSYLYYENYHSGKDCLYIETEPSLLPEQNIMKCFTESVVTKLQWSCIHYFNISPQIFWCLLICFPFSHRCYQYILQSLFFWFINT